MSDAGSGTGDRCEHFAAIQALKRVAEGCEECLAMGAAWTELRVCLTCGHVGCCEDSVHAHALQHFNMSGHPLIVPARLQLPSTLPQDEVAVCRHRCRSVYLEPWSRAERFHFIH